MNIEEKLKEIIADVLELDDPDMIQKDSDFFELGGNSLTAMIVAEQIKDTFGCELDFTEMYESAGFDDLVKMIAGSMAAAKEPCA